MATFLHLGKNYTFGDLCALYAHPQTGDLQTLQEWIEDSTDWEGDIPSQISTLIRVYDNE